MNRLILIGIVVLALNLQTGAQGIVFFQGTFQEALKKADAENKKVFVDVYTTWCGPCKKMSKTTFVDDSVGEFYNNNFINIKIDAEKGEGITIAKYYEVSGYPTLLYLNPQGNVIRKLTSAADAKLFLELGNSIINVNDDFDELKTKFTQNKITKDELYQYLVLLQAKELHGEVETVFNKYFILEAKGEITEQLLNMVPQYASNSDSEAFQYLINHREEFNKTIGAEKVSESIDNFYKDEFAFKNYNSDEEYFSAKKVLKSRVKISNRDDLDFDVNYYWNIKNEDKYIELAEVFVEKYCSEDAQTIANILGATYWVVKKESLSKLKDWAHLAVSLDDSFLNNAQLAFAYYALKDLTNGDKYFIKAEKLGISTESTYMEQLREMKKYYLEVKK